jgi:molybdopterin-guanine dinucleotide biosynthesis protein A
MSQSAVAPSPLVRSEITGVILAGGRSTRMGGEDKGLIQVGERPLVEHVIRAMRPQVSDLLISANRHLDRYRAFGLTVVTDLVDGNCGPLAGIASAMKVARTTWILAVPCDSPFIGRDLAARLYEASVGDSGDGAVACSAPGRIEPVFALLRRALLPSLLEYLGAGERKVERFYSRHPITTVDFSDEPTMFANLNTPEDVVTASEQLAKRPS